MIKKLLANNEAFILPAVLSFIIVIVILMGALLEIINTNFSTVNNNVKSQQAFNIAEAGINYYLWHLSHNGTDYQDGHSGGIQDPTLGYGPYVHNYVDTNAINEGTFKLYIKPQGGGSTIVTVRSIGQVKNDSNIRTVVAQIGAASFASYGVVSDSALWFGNTETADGPVLSNQGVRMDGPNTDTVSAANSTYTPPFAYGGCSAGNCSHPGVWCDPSITSPVNCNTRNKSNWLYPTTSVDFNQVTGSLCTMKKVAFADNSSTAALANQSNACNLIPTTRTSSYLPQRGTCSPSNSTNCSYSATKGYLIKLNNNGTYDLLNVNNEDDRLSPYTSALTTSAVATGIAIPPSGVIFAEDNVWVLSNPTFHGRVTIAAGRLAQSTINAEIVISGPLAYSSKNGSDVIGLVSEASVFIAPYAPPATGAFNLEIDAAVLAETQNVTYGENSESTTGNGTFQPDYRAQQSKCARGWVNSNQTLNFYGSVATRQIWTWVWDFGSGQSAHCGDNAQGNSGHWVSGILNNTTTYDYNLLYNPPPSYPITSSYQIISWREVLTRP